jgi:hypothetical protein
MRESYREICDGEDPWIPLGNFMNDYFGNAPEMREELVKDPIQEPEDATSDQHRWAVFCAASVEYLCQKYGVSCPDWVHSPEYTLTEPWYYSLGAHKPHIRERLTRETPEPFTRRNIYCGSRIFANKYELAADRLHRRSA